MAKKIRCTHDSGKGKHIQCMPAAGVFPLKCPALGIVKNHADHVGHMPISILTDICENLGWLYNHLRATDSQRFSFEYSDKQLTTANAWTGEQIKEILYIDEEPCEDDYLQNQLEKDITKAKETSGETGGSGEDEYYLRTSEMDEASQTHTFEDDGEVNGTESLIEQQEDTINRLKLLVKQQRGDIVKLTRQLLNKTT